MALLDLALFAEPQDCMAKDGQRLIEFLLAINATSK